MSEVPERPKLPKIAQKMLDILSDYEEHSVEELKECLTVCDDLTPNTNIQRHLNIVRRYLSLEGKGLHCNGHKKGETAKYRLVVLIRTNIVGK